jgi:hypothetical protein
MLLMQNRTTAGSNMFWCEQGRLFVQGAQKVETRIYIYLLCARSDPVTAVANVTPCSLRHIHWHFGGTRRFHHQGWCEKIRFSQTSESFYPIKRRPSPEAACFYLLPLFTDTVFTPRYIASNYMMTGEWRNKGKWKKGRNYRRKDWQVCGDPTPTFAWRDRTKQK